MKDLHLEAGLIPCGFNSDGEQEYIGTDKQWRDYDRMTDVPFEEPADENEVREGKRSEENDPE